jgi:hypothetical protein
MVPSDLIKSLVTDYEDDLARGHEETNNNALTMIINNGKISITCTKNKKIKISSQIKRLNIMMEKALPVFLNQQKRIKSRNTFLERLLTLFLCSTKYSRLLLRTH